jgi:hypothetical protein
MDIKTEARVPLEVPIQVGGQEIKELILRRPKMGVLLKLHDTTAAVNREGSISLGSIIDVLFIAIEGCTSLERKDVEQIDLAADLPNVLKELMGFFEGSPISGMLSQLSPTSFTSLSAS